MIASRPETPEGLLGAEAATIRHGVYPAAGAVLGELDFVDRRSQDFRLIWENNGIFIYRILRNPIHYD